MQIWNICLPKFHCESMIEAGQQSRTFKAISFSCTNEASDSAFMPFIWSFNNFYEMKWINDFKYQSLAFPKLID